MQAKRRCVKPNWISRYFHTCLGVKWKSISVFEYHNKQRQALWVCLSCFYILISDLFNATPSNNALQLLFCIFFTSGIQNNQASIAKSIGPSSYVLHDCRWIGNHLLQALERRYRQRWWRRGGGGGGSRTTRASLAVHIAQASSAFIGFVLATGQPASQPAQGCELRRIEKNMFWSSSVKRAFCNLTARTHPNEAC